MSQELLAQEPAALPVVAEDEGMGMIGLEEMPMRFVALPRVRLVQPGSTNIMLRGGEHEALKGRFYYDHFEHQVESVEMAIIKAKPFVRVGPSLNDPSVIEKKESIGVLYFDLLINQVCTFTLRPGSFSSWRGLMSRFLASHNNGDMDTSFSRVVHVTSEMIKTTKNTYYMAKFGLGDLLDDKTLDIVTEEWKKYHTYFDQPDLDVEED